jgi:hypothetical protein
LLFLIQNKEKLEGKQEQSVIKKNYELQQPITQYFRIQIVFDVDLFVDHALIFLQNTITLVCQQLYTLLHEINTVVATIYFGQTHVQYAFDRL